MGAERRGTVLMLCYHYPPGTSGGVARSARFAKHLPEFGWKPVVVTTSRWGEGGGDAGEEAMRPGELLRRSHGCRRAEGPGGAAAETTALSGGGEAGPRATLTRFAEKWLLIPDKHVRWTAAAFAPALRTLKRLETGALYTSSPPASAHTLGLSLKRLTGKPWIMDLRDPWTIEPLAWYLRAGGRRLSLERRIERACFESADAIVTSTPEAAAGYALLYPWCANKMHSIPNGFDASEVETARASLSESEHLRGIGDEVFVVGHVGTFCRHSDSTAYPKGLLDAAEALAREGAISPRDFRIIFAGAMNPGAKSRIEARGLGGLLLTTGPVSRVEALRIMLRADLLLLYDPNPVGRYYVHGKLYEYLAAGRPILGVLPEGASRTLLARSGRGIMIQNDSADEIRAALLDAIGRRGKPPARADFDISRYEGRELTSELARILALLGRKPGA